MIDLPKQTGDPSVQLIKIYITSGASGRSGTCYMFLNKL